MRILVALLIVILSFPVQISAQEMDTINVFPTSYNSVILPEFSSTRISQDAAFTPILSKDMITGFGFQNSSFPNMNLKSDTGWKIETGTSIGIQYKFGFLVGNNLSGLYRRSAWDIYEGIYGMRTYQLSDKFYAGTAGYSDKSFNEYSLKSGFYRQTNYSSSLFVGYKFSEKFSISAGFTIQRNGDPLNRNPVMQNGGMFP